MIERTEAIEPDFSVGVLTRALNATPILVEVASLESRGSQVPSDLMDRRAQVYAKEMRRRAEAASGTRQVQSEPGRGTRVTAWLPLSPPPPDMEASQGREWQP